MTLVPQLVEITAINEDMAMNLLVATNNNLAESINLALAMDAGGGPASGAAAAAPSIHDANPMPPTNYSQNFDEDIYAGSGMGFDPDMMDPGEGDNPGPGAGASGNILSAVEREHLELQEAIRLSEAANGGTASSLPQPALANTSSSSSFEDEDGVRKADSIKRQRLLPEGMNSASRSYLNIRRHSNGIHGSRRRRTGDPNNPFAMSDSRYGDDYDGPTPMEKQEKADAEREKMKTISNLFKPPTDLCVKGELTHCRDMCQPLPGNGSSSAVDESDNHYKWLLVNIQYPTEWACHVLNRDVWKNEMVIEIVRASFKLWQQVYEPPTQYMNASTDRHAQGQNLTEAQMFVERYRLVTSNDSFPFIGILDPRTGLLVWRYENRKKKKKRAQSESDGGDSAASNNQNIVSVDQFIERLMEFVTENPYPGAKDVATVSATAAGNTPPLPSTQQSVRSEVGTEVGADVPETQTQVDTQADIPAESAPGRTEAATRMESTSSILTTTTTDTTVFDIGAHATHFCSDDIDSWPLSNLEGTSSSVALRFKFVFPLNNTSVVCSDLTSDSTVMHLLQWALPHLHEHTSQGSAGERRLFDVQWGHPSASLHERVRQHVAERSEGGGDGSGDILQHIASLRLSDLKIGSGIMRVVLP